MVRCSGKYTGQLRVETIHDPSGTKLDTDAPTDNKGRGESFSPTDLIGTALATCVLTTMGIVAEREGIEMGNANFTVDKEMSNSPRRISSLTVEFYLPKSWTPEQRTILERTSMACPVHFSLHPDVKMKLNYNYTL